MHFILFLSLPFFFSLTLNQCVMEGGDSGLGIFVYLLLTKKDRYGISAFGLEEMNSMFSFQKNLKIFFLISSA